MEGRIGRYELVGTLGTGASATVYEALLHGPFGFCKPVALKVVDEDGGDRYREARLSSRLQHPNVVAVFAVEELEGRCCLAMELVSGPSARSLASEGPYPDRAVVELGLQVLEGLAHIHSHGLVHRDVKPANLLIDTQGTVKLTDLGVASPIGSEQSASGTYGYLPLEQCTGEARPASDLFAFGATLYRLSTGRGLFDRGPVALVQAADADRFLERKGALEKVRHPGLRELIRHCVRKDWRDRPRSAREVAGALGRLMAPGLEGASLKELVRERYVAQVVPVVLEAGRVEVLGRDALVERLLADEAPWLTLHGEGGIGKTAVLRVLEQRLEGAVYVDVEGADTEHAMAMAVARTTGAPLPGRDAPLRSVCEGWNGTLLLDHVEDVSGWDRAVADVVARCPGVRVRVASVSVLHPARPTEERVPVEPLTDEAAGALYRARSGADVVDVELLAGLEGNPLAIELAAAGLKRGTEPTSGSRHTSLEAALASVLRLLPSWGLRAIARLAAFENGFTMRAAAAVLDGDLPEPLEVLDQLQRAGLLRFDPRAERFRLPGHVRRHGRIASPDEASVGRALHLAWFAQLGSAAMISALHEPENGVLRTEILAEVRDLEAANRFARTIGRADEAHATALAASWAWSFDGPSAAAESVLEQVASLQGPRLADVLLRLSFFAVVRDDTDSALRLAARCSEVARAHGVTRVELQAEQRIGQILLRRGELDDARRVIQRALARATRVGDARHQASASVLLSSLSMREGDVEGALVLAEEAARFAEAVRWVTAVIVGWTNAGLFQTSLGEDEHALESLERARECARQLGNTRRTTSAGIWVADVRLRSGDLEGATRTLEALRPTLARLADPLLDARVGVLDGCVLLEGGDLDGAVEGLTPAVEALAALDAEEGGCAGVELATALLERGDALEARRVIKTSLKSLPERRWVREIAHLLALRGRARRRPEDVRRARALLAGHRCHPRVLRAIRRAEAELGMHPEPPGRTD